MIIEILLNIVYSVLNILLFFEIPQLPTEVLGYINQFFDYLVVGASVLGNYTPLPYLMILFGLLLSVDASILIYHFVMWVIRKIPVLSMS